MQDPREKFPKPGKNEKEQRYPALEANMVTKPDYGADTYKGAGRLAGKSAIVTGGDSGIGRAVAVAFAREGADILVAHLPGEEVDADETLAAIKAGGRKGIGVAGDLKDLKSAQEIVAKAKTEFGKIDILVNNAGLQRSYKTMDEIPPEHFAEIYQVNVIAPFVLSREAARFMQPGGSIINTVSIQAYDPDFILLPYAVSKGAFVALTKGLAEQLIKQGIRVNAVAPGPIWSPLNTHGSPPEKLKTFGEKSAFGRPGQPIELSPIYVLLASDEASFITGEIYGVTGGDGIA